MAELRETADRENQNPRPFSAPLEKFPGRCGVLGMTNPVLLTRLAKETQNYLPTSSSSTSKINVAFGGMTEPAPLAP